MQKTAIIFEDSESEYDVSSVDEDDEDSIDMSLVNGNKVNGHPTSMNDQSKGIETSHNAVAAANTAVSTVTGATAVGNTTTTGSSTSIKLMRSSNGAIALIDVGLHKCRVVFALSVSTIICLCTLYRGGLYQFRSVQKTRVKHGQQHVKQFQDKFRNAFLDVYFGT